MTTTNPVQTTDPRPYHRQSLAWVQSLIAGIAQDQLDTLTPCTDYPVRTLLGHLLAVVEKPRVVAEGGGVFSVPHIMDGVPDDGWPAAFDDAVRRTTAVWEDDAVLDREVSAPWGSVPGRAALWGFCNETVVHGWDLAIATGQDPEADPALATAVLAVAEQLLPANVRGDGVPFDPPVPPRDGAGPTERLANWSGHRG